MSRALARSCTVAWVAFVAAAVPAAFGQGLVAVEEGTPIAYRANPSDPGLGMSWVEAAFDDAAWARGVYGIGNESGSGASNLISTSVPQGTRSIYTRASFEIDDVATVNNLFIGADYDDAFVAWINGVEVYRSPEVPAGSLAWDTAVGSHESSNGSSPDYGALEDVSAAGIPALHDGSNLLAVAVWNVSSGSSDLVLVPKLAWNLPLSVARGPYLQMPSPDGIVIRWRSTTPSDSRVRYGSTPESLDASVDVPGERTEHAVTLAGLAPDTLYHYAVGSSGSVLAGGDDEHFFRTPPAAGSDRSLRVWVLGDSGTANADARAVRDAYDAFTADVRTDLWLMLGDNAYPDGTDEEYQAAVFDMYRRRLRQSGLWPTLGNHDGHSASSATQSGPYYDIFSLPTAGQAGGVASGTEAYYSFDFGNVHFVCLNSHDVDRSSAGAMATWLEQDLMSTAQDWTVAFWHHPPYSKGSHDSDSETRLIEMRQTVLPILEDWGVDLVLTGHSHSYERSYLLDGHYGSSSDLTGAMVLDPGDGRLDGDGVYRKPTPGPAPHEGAVYVVAGSSGKTSPGPLDHPVMYRSVEVLGSLVLDVEGHRLEASFIDDAGALQDYFTIRKGAAGAPLADFACSPRSGPAPLSVGCTDLSTATGITSWSWDLDGDGVSDSTAQNPTVTYADAGSYTVRLTVTNPSGSDTRTRIDHIVVTSSLQPPAPPAGLRVD